MTKAKPKKTDDKKAEAGNLLTKLAQQKAEEQASGRQKSQFGKDLSSKLSKRGHTFFVPTKPGGRNGQGKP